MKSSLTFLGVDVGAESGRLMAGLWDGRRIVLQEQHRFANGGVTVGNTLRWDLLHLWKQIKHSLTLAGRAYGGSIRSIGVDTWGVDYVMMTQTGEWLGLPYSYRDPRTHGLVEEVVDLLSRERVFAESGAQFLEINTLYQLLAMQRQNPGLLAQARHMLMIPDWIHWALSGSEVCEFSNATTTQFVHPTTRQWSTGLLHRLGIPTHFLPEIVPSGTPIGSLRAGVASAAGLHSVPVIAPATHDTASAVVGVPTTRTGTASWAYISSGTWSLVGVEIQRAALGENVLRHNFTNEGGVDGTYRLLKNVMGMWLVQQLRAAFAASGHDHDYHQLVQLASHAESLRSLINPDDPCFMRPANMVVSIQNYCLETGQPVPETAGQLVRCVLESLALRYSQIITQLEEITGETIEVIHIVGGGGKNSLLNQFTADACNRPVIAGPTEATALGNVLFQAKAAHEIATLSDVRSVIRESFEHELREFYPEPKHLGEWDAAFHKWHHLVSSALH